MTHSQTHFSGKAALKAIVESEGKVLLIRDAREKEEIWELPGGRMDSGEDPKEGLKREIQEELGVVCDVHEVVCLEQFWQKSESAQALMIAFRVTLSDPGASFNLSTEEIAEVRWCNEEEVSKLRLFKEYEDTLVFYFANRNK